MQLAPITNYVLAAVTMPGGLQCARCGALMFYHDDRRQRESPVKLSWFEDEVVRGYVVIACRRLQCTELGKQYKLPITRMYLQPALDTSDEV